MGVVYCGGFAGGAGAVPGDSGGVGRIGNHELHKVSPATIRLDTETTFDICPKSWYTVVGTVLDFGPPDHNLPKEEKG